MTATFDTQCHPLTVAETVQNDGMSVRMIQRSAGNCNNYLKRVGNYPLVIEGHNCDGTPKSEFQTIDANTDDNVMAYLGKFHLPEIYDTLRISVVHRLFAGLGDGTTTWTVSSSINLYVGPRVVEYSRLIQRAYQTFESDDDDWQVSRVTLTCGGARSHTGAIYLLLTGKNSHTNARATYCSLTIQPTIA